jgi:hypothetical protein
MRKIPGNKYPGSVLSPLPFHVVDVKGLHPVLVLSERSLVQEPSDELTACSGL